MTYSIVARDPETGALGVAVQTCMFAVGAVVPWARAGVGAVATQAFGEPAYGPRCLDALVGGRSAEEALLDARAEDPSDVMRQVGVADARGTAAAFTGDLCVGYAGQLVGAGYAVQANMMTTPQVWPAMATAYEAAAGSFPQRLLTALLAGEAAGGDARGGMAAALLVVDGEKRAEPTAGVLVDIRVDHHERPLDELARLLQASDAFASYFRAIDAMGAGDAVGALAEIERATIALPDDENIRFARAGALLLAGRIDEGRAVMRSLVADRPSWVTIARSLADKGMFPTPPDVDLEELLRP